MKQSVCSATVEALAEPTIVSGILNAPCAEQDARGYAAAQECGMRFVLMERGAIIPLRPGTVLILEYQ